MRHRVWTPVLLMIVAVGTVMFWFASYDPDDFRGAGPLRDDGFFSYYRYHAPLGTLPLAGAGTYTFEFSGLPSERMVLQLYLEGMNESHRDRLLSLSTRIHAELESEDGDVLCEARGSPGNARTQDTWVLMSSKVDAAFWHDNCRDIKVSNNSKYRLRISLENIDMKSPNVTMLAMLEGGGNELP